LTQHSDLAGAIEAATGSAVVQMRAVHGGDFAAAYRVDLGDGRRLFAKTHSSPPPGFFTTEATGLAWLRAADALPVPQVIAVDDGPPAMLLLEWIDIGRHSMPIDTDFGRALARLHDAGAPSFGREDRRTTGSRALPNDPCPTWAEFYATRRLLPLATLARESGSLASATVSALERVAHNLERFDDGEPPARLHGDLWAGNRVVDVDGRSWLIDPAAHGGHREFDLAMMRLFGGFGPECFAAYAEVHPLVEGWQDRVALHQLAPLVVHAIKFGGHYVGMASAAIERY
jgi:fructosamine-3-kinase